MDLGMDFLYLHHMVKPEPHPALHSRILVVTQLEKNNKTDQD
mgnify:CR=1 FL=1